MAVDENTDYVKTYTNDLIADDDDDDDDDNNLAGATVKDPIKEATRTAKRTKARETLFQRIEESRKSLEDELGTEKFLKVYRYIQVSFILFSESLNSLI